MKKMSVFFSTLVLTLLFTVPCFADTIPLECRSENIKNDQVVDVSNKTATVTGIQEVVFPALKGFHQPNNNAKIKVKSDEDLKIDTPYVRNRSSLIVQNGTGSGTYKYQTEVTCTQTCPTSTQTDPLSEGYITSPNGYGYSGYGSGTRAKRIRKQTFDNWTCNNNSTANTIVYVMPEDSATITAKWSWHQTGWDNLQHYLTVTNGTGTNWYNHNSTATATANTKPSDYTESSWSGQTAATIGNIRYQVHHAYTYDNGTSKTFTMNQPHSINMGYTDTKTNVNKQKYTSTVKCPGIDEVGYICCCCNPGKGRDISIGIAAGSMSPGGTKSGSWSHNDGSTSGSWSAKCNSDYSITITFNGKAQIYRHQASDHGGDCSTNGSYTWDLNGWWLKWNAIGSQGWVAC